VRPWLRLGALVVSLGTAACAPLSASPVTPPATPPLPVPPLCTQASWDWSADGSAVLASCERGVEIREGDSGVVRAQLATPGSASGILNGDASLVALPMPGRVELRRGKDLSLQSVVLLDAGSAVTPLVAFSPDGQRLAALLLPDLLVEVSVADARVLWRLDDALAPGSMPMRLRYVGETLHISMDRGPSVAFLRGKAAYPRWLRQNARPSVNHDGSKLLLFDGYSKNTLWDVTTDQPLATPEDPLHTRQRWLGDYIAAELPGGGIRLWGTGTPAAHWLVPGARLLDSQATPDGAHLRGVVDGELVEWALPSLSPRRLAWAPPPRLERLSHGFLLETRPTEATLLRASDRREVARLVTAGQTVRRQFATIRGELAIVVDVNGKRVLRIAGKGPERTLPNVSDAITFDPLAPRAAFATQSTIRVIDTNTLTPLLDLPDPPDRDQFEFRPAQNQLVILHRKQKLSFVDLETGRTAMTVPFASRYGELRVSANGEYVAHAGSGQVTVWSSRGVQQWSDPNLEAATFSTDSRLIHLLLRQKLVTRELATGGVVQEEMLPGKASASLAGDGVVLVQEGAQAARELAPGPWRLLGSPSLRGVHTLGFRGGSLLLFDGGGSVLDWRIASLHVASALRAPQGFDARLSPDGSLLSVRSERYGSLFDINARWQISERSIDAWSLDGSACLQSETVVPTDGSLNALQFAGAVAFAGDARSLFASPGDDLVLHDLRTPTAEPRVIARGGRLVAQSADQRTIAVTTDHGRSLSVLRAPGWPRLGSAIPENGARIATLSQDGGYLAVVNESHELRVWRVTPNGVKPASLSIVLPPAPAVSRMTFTPDARFLLLDGTPLRFVRLADGEVLNAYIARSDTVERLSALLLFVDARGRMEGDATLARQLYCDSAPVQLAPPFETPPCRMPLVAPGLVARYFAQQ